MQGPRVAHNMAKEDICNVSSVCLWKDAQNSTRFYICLFGKSPAPSSAFGGQKFSTKSSMGLNKENGICA